ncbi:hypothetical protein ACFSR9_13370 [Deinococcus taklimakanensis]|uniref:AAA+ ATPase domain-containing protein n=1 Tax=Deinococcus taklimakanensis TaxID=536443 RepID=A0ABW5P5N3_9DEIO
MNFDVQERIVQDYEKLLAILPFDIRDALRPVIAEAEEVKLRFGLPLKIKHHGTWHRYEHLVINQAHLSSLHSSLESPIRDDNRTGLNGTGHRISKVPGPDGKEIIGFNLRIARFYGGIAEVLRAVLHENPSILICGLAGKGKSTLLRDVIRVVAEKYDANVTVVDTSNEVAGDGKVPHPGIGEADRYFVPVKARQHEVMLEAVANNSAHIVAIDEIQRLSEAETIRDLSVKARFIGSTHGDDMEALIHNRSLAPLFHPVPVFAWALLIREIGVYDLYDLEQAVEDARQGRPVTPRASFTARIQGESQASARSTCPEAV